MNLQTKIPLEKQSENLIDYNSNILLLGSCFVENIGEKFEFFKFQNLQNPFGILFNPVVIERLVTNAVNRKVYSEDDLFFHNECWYCYDVHSDLSSSSKEELLKNLNEAIKLTKKQIHDSTHIIVTLGTAWVYKNIELDEIVANCHKVPQKQFEKELLSIKDINENLKSLVSNISKINSEASIIFTVSPVRHLKDGFVENQQSKAHLISAIHKLLSAQIKEKNISYYPSYEIMMDELRDYRFYAEDMIHPSQTAINYIWEKVKQNWISEKSYGIMDEVESIQKGLNHKPFNPDSNGYIELKKSLINRIRMIQEQYGHVKFV